MINLSLGGSGGCTAAYVSAINQLTAAGVVVVAAAGNSEGLAVSTPANCPGVIAVGGVRHVGTKVGYSDAGPEIAISAPAGNCVNTTGACLYPVLTTTNSGTTTPATNTYSNSTNFSVGTSFSTPLVSGTAALMLSANPSLTPARLKALVQSSARPFPTTSSDPTVTQCHAPNGQVQDECICTTSTCGAGLLDAGAAVAAAAANAAPTVTISPSATSVLAGAGVIFDASGSTAPSGRTIASYSWTITSGASIASVSGAANGSSFTVKTSGVGSFTVRLTVTDSVGQSASATSTVSVNAPAGPVANLLASATVVAAGSTVSFDGTGSSVAPGLSIAAYQWTITSGNALAQFTSSTNASTAAAATAGNGSGSFSVRLTVTDSIGKQSTANATIAVTAVGPTASISATAPTVPAGASVGFDGSASTAPSGRAISSYQWAITSGGNIAMFSGATNGSTVSVATAAAGSFTVQLTVTDSAGVQAVNSAAVTATAAAPGGAGGSGGGSGGGGGGGGALSVNWLLVLAAATIALGSPRRRPRRRRRQV